MQPNKAAGANAVVGGGEVNGSAPEACCQLPVQAMG
jgi:hypothetical protein